ncbi:MAG: GIY-YIG nuclease family protein [Ignavibacteriaceae bacterium]|nr:GIY-YIG nuclease family protein [Ignavibacteriaceae bacterium]
MHFVYILRNSQGKHSIGETEDLQRRIVEHNKDNGHFTGFNGPWEIIASHSCSDKSEARRLEKKLKSFKNPGYAIKYLSELRAQG